MKPVLLFVGPDYEAGGGWRDFDSDHDTVDEARKRVDEQVTIEVIPAYTVHGLHVSTNGPPVLEVHHPARRYVKAPFGWAHIVVDGTVVAEWSEGHWE